ncbi:MAG TPA: TIR domain-containing protein [Blastocatellia bacterium]|nr:TIR domain-containing protein [Blastocatellia bacterium]
MAIRLYYSYDSEDDRLQAELQKHLAVLKRSQQIMEWGCRDIKAGQEWRRQSNDNLDNAQIILLLLSPDYLASDYLFEYEMTRAIEKHRAREARVIPVILRACDWQNARVGKPPNDISLGDLEALPKEAKPVTKWTNRDEAFCDIAGGIREVITELKPVSRESLYKPEIPDILPYLCDRSDQEDLLEVALGQEGGKPRRPFVSIIHGDEDECPERFKDRLLQYSLPRFLDIDTNQSSLRAYQVKWPSKAILGQPVHVVYRNNLAESLTGKRKAPMEAVADELSKSPVPIMFYSYLHSQDASCAKSVQSFLAFWDNFPDLPSGSRLISCLIIKHDADNPDGVRNKADVVASLKNLMTFRMTPQSRECLEMEGLPAGAVGRLADLIDRKIVGEEAFINEVRARLGAESPKEYEEMIQKAALNLELGVYERISGVILPEMSPVSEQEATDWVLDDRLFRDFCRRHSPSFCNTDEAIMRISALYNELMPRIPMQPLARELKQLIEEKRC